MKTKKELQRLVQAAGEKVVAHASATVAPGPALSSDLVVVIGLVDELIQHLPEGPIIIPLNARPAASADAPIEARPAKVSEFRVPDGLGGTIPISRALEIRESQLRDMTTLLDAERSRLAAANARNAELEREAASRTPQTVPPALSWQKAMVDPEQREKQHVALVSAGINAETADLWAGISFAEAVRQALAENVKVLELFDVIDGLHAKARHTLRNNLDLRETAVREGAAAGAKVGHVANEDYWRRVAEVVIETALGLEA